MIMDTRFTKGLRGQGLLLLVACQFCAWFIHLNELLKTRCSMKPDGGICLAEFDRAYFNPPAKACFEFVYGGLWRSRAVQQPRSVQEGLQGVKLGRFMP